MAQPPTPRLIRLRDAPTYPGMDKNRFNRKVRSNLAQIPIGKQGIAFDRLEIDAWLEDYVKCNGRRPKLHQVEDDICQNETKCRGILDKVTNKQTVNQCRRCHRQQTDQGRDKITEERGQDRAVKSVCLFGYFRALCCCLTAGANGHTCLVPACLKSAELS